MRIKYILAILTLVAALIWSAALSKPDDNLHLIACDVGQGDAILAMQGSVQILIDGGKPNGEAVRCLADHLPFWDKEIELVIISHPQEDHYGGLVEVFESYSVDTVLTSGLDSSNQSWQLLENLVGGGGTKVVYASAGQKLRVDSISLDIVSPPHSSSFASESSSLAPTKGEYAGQASPSVIARSETTWQSSEQVLGTFTSDDDPNNYSVVVDLTYGDFGALLTGDIGPKISPQVEASLQKLVLSDSQRIEYLKVPHHGSKNGLTQELLDILKPEIAVISVGQNPWGHPHQETLDMLKDIKLLRTDTSGDVEVISDGEDWWVK